MSDFGGFAESDDRLGNTVEPVSLDGDFTLDGIAGDKAVISQVKEDSARGVLDVGEGVRQAEGDEARIPERPLLQPL